MLVTALWGRETRMNISLHNPDLYFFLCLLAGVAMLLPIIYEFSRPGRWNRAKPLDVVDQPQVKPQPRAVSAPSGRATDAITRDSQSVPAGERFSRLSESIKNLTPKEQTTRVHEYFWSLRMSVTPEGPGSRSGTSRYQLATFHETVRR